MYERAVMTWSPEKQDRMDELSQRRQALKERIAGMKGPCKAWDDCNAELSDNWEEYSALLAERAFYRMEGIERNGE